MGIILKKYLLIVGVTLHVQILTAQPVINSFSPKSGPIGSSVTINGSNFSSIAANNIVYFGGVQAKIKSASGSALVVIVPDGATYQPITVTTNMLTAYSTLPFLVTFQNAGLNLSNSFTEEVDLAGIPYPGSTCIADLDGDGKPDIVMVNNNSYNISILRNIGAPGMMAFAPRLDYITDANAASVCVGDLDGDGKLDLAVACRDANAISIFLNTGSIDTISFGPRHTYAAGSGPADIGMQDLDGDGKPDLIVVNSYSNTISIFRNTSTLGNISFAPRVDLPTGADPFKAGIGDLNSDGKPDLAVVNRSGNSVLIFQNNCISGVISFVAISVLKTGVKPQCVSMGDLDGDGNVDLVVSNFDTVNTVSIFKNTGNKDSISFESRQDFNAGTYPSYVSIGDLDGDGQPDLAISNYINSTLSLLKNTSSGGTISFDSLVQYPAPGNPIIASIGDLDQDGRPDLATTNIVYGKLSVLRNLGNELFLTSFTPALAGPGATVTIKGKKLTGATSVSFGGAPAASFSVLTDSTITAVVSTGLSGNITVSTPAGIGGFPGFTFTNRLTISSFMPYKGPVGTLVTFEGANFDSVPDNNIVYFGPTRAKIVSGNTTSLTFAIPAGGSVAPFSLTTKGITIFTGPSFNLTFPGAAAIFYTNTFSAKKDFPAGAAPFMSCVGDLDGDGKPDIAISNYGSNTFSIYQNTGFTGLISFAQKVDIVCDNNPIQIAMADIDGDGKLDIIIISGHSNTVSIFRNTSSVGTISFAEKIDYTAGPYPYSLAVGDLDGDGRIDLAVGNLNSNTVSLFKNSSSVGSISFNSKLDIPVISNPFGIHLRDFNGDGKLDLAVIGYYSDLAAIYMNQSADDTLSFTYSTDFSTGDQPYGINSADMNADGNPDLIVGNINGNTFSMYRNVSVPWAIAFNAQQPVTVVSPTGLAVADLDGDGIPDLAVGSSAENYADLFKNITPAGAVGFIFASNSYATGNNPIGISAADFDGDGKPDLVSANYNSNTISVLRNTVGEAIVVPSGSNPVSDTIVVNKPVIDSVIQTFNGYPFVQRHYDIQPISNPTTATATITLFFSQSDFDNFNAYPSHGPSLPTQPSDTAGIANIRIYQYHGISLTNQPGGYAGPGIEINPADSNIVWNSNTQLWEITFNVTGFSGFFLSNETFEFRVPLPPTIIITGDTIFCQGDHVLLTSSAISYNQWYKNGMSISGDTTNMLQVYTSGIYTVTTSLNGIVSSQSSAITVNVKPIPNEPAILRQGNSLLSSSLSGNQWYYHGSQITGANNQIYNPTIAGLYTVAVTLDSCVSPPSSGYYFITKSLINIDSTHFINLSPIPASNQVKLNFNVAGSAILNLRIFDMQGRTYGIHENLQDGDQFNVSGLASGVYIVKIYDNTNTIDYVTKLIKQ